MTATLGEEIEFPSLDAATVEPLDGTPEEGKPKTRRRRSDAGQPRGPRGTGTTPRATNTAKLEKDLLLPIAKLGQALSFSLPTVGAVLIARGEVTSRALVNFAQGHPKMLAALHKVGKVGPSSDLIETIAMCVIAANLDLRKMHPEHPVAVLTGVSGIYAEMHGYMSQPPQGQEDEEDSPVTPGDAFANIQPPPPEYIMDGYNADGTFTAPGAFRAGPSAATRNNE